MSGSEVKIERMPVDKNRKIVPAIIIVCAVFSAASVFSRPEIFKKESGTAWREEFVPAFGSGINSLPAGWKLKRKPGTNPAIFSIKKDLKEGGSFLHMKADLRQSASLITRVDGMDITKTPLLRWRWRATVLPEGADGRVKSRDDQAIGIYVGAGNILNNKSVSYRWDTQTPRGAEGNCTYGIGAIRVKWYTLRNKEDLEDNKWFIEERNVLKDFKNAWGFYPEKIYLSVSCNSQYTNSQAGADLDWIEFVNAPQSE